MEAQAQRFCKSRKSLKRCINIERKEGLLIAEEILKILVSPNTHFQESMREYICNKLDISDISLAGALDIISKENGK